MKCYSQFLSLLPSIQWRIHEGGKGPFPCEALITARKRCLRRLCFYTCLSVLLFIEGVCLSACWDTKHPPPGPDPPGTRHIPRPSTIPGPGTPLRSACWEIRSTSGRYVSYWNAILFSIQSHSLIKSDLSRFQY